MAQRKEIGPHIDETVDGSVPERKDPAPTTSKLTAGQLILANRDPFHLDLFVHANPTEEGNVVLSISDAVTAGRYEFAMVTGTLSPKQMRRFAESLLAAVDLAEKIQTNRKRK